MSCRELVELVTDYLDGALSETDRARFEAHIEECPGCADHLEQVRVTIAAVGTLREDDLAPDAQEALLAAFRGWKDGRGAPDGGL